MSLLKARDTWSPGSYILHCEGSLGLFGLPLDQLEPIFVESRALRKGITLPKPQSDRLSQTHIVVSYQLMDQWVRHPILTLITWAPAILWDCFCLGTEQQAIWALSVITVSSCRLNLYKNVNSGLGW